MSLIPGVISSSQQEANQYAGGGTGYSDSEEYWCRKIVAEAATVAKASGLFDLLVPNGGSYSANVTAGNKHTGTGGFYLAVHTNALDGKADGTITFYKPNNTFGKAFAEAIQAAIAPISPGSDYGVKASSTLGEVNKPSAKYVCLVELAFHDNLTEAAHIRQNYAVYGRALGNAIVKFFSDSSTNVTPTRRTLKLTTPHMQGADVKELQVMLLKLGFALPKYGADGDFGEETDTAVRAFQAKYAVAGGADGIVGLNTWTKLEEAYEKATAPTPTPVPGPVLEPVDDYRVGFGWAETPEALKLVESKAVVLDVLLVSDGPAFYFHANLDKTKEIEAVIAASPQLHRFHAVRVDKNAYSYMGVADSGTWCADSKETLQLVESLSNKINVAIKQAKSLTDTLTK